MVRCVTNKGIIWYISWMTTNRKTKTPNIWFCRPCIEFSPLKNEKPISREHPTVRTAFE
jgi:hypothetical protein